MTQRLTLKNMKFHAFHGCLEHEQNVGTQYVVSVTMYFDTSDAGKSDDLRDTVDYQKVYNIVKTEMEKRSNLIENVAWRIVGALKKNIPTVENWDIKLTKMNPPLGGKVDKAIINIIV